jgi:phospholipid-binding lipoprotein MlaA
MWQRSLPGIVACTLLLSAPPALASAAHDPFEGVNRRIHAFNRSLQVHVLTPVANAYRSLTSPGTRQGVANAVSNLGEPIVAASGLAAGQVDVALNAAVRFGINSTLGLGGVVDRAAEMGYPPRAFGPADALCSWGVPSGPFLMLPVLGPSTVRDAGAWIATSTALSQALGSDVLVGWSAGNAFTTYERFQPELDRIDAEALDGYAVYRSIHLHRRAASCAVDRAGLAQAEEVAEEDEAVR